MIQINGIPKVWVCISAFISVSLTYTIDWQCDWDLFNCDDPYTIEQTLQFRCRTMDDCPTNFVCCSHKCFRHKICQPFKNRNTPHISKLSSDSSEEKLGECNVIVSCNRLLPEAFTKSFECFQDNDCPDHYKCCFVSCYNHKVCQPAKDIFTDRTITTSYTTSSESSTKPSIAATTYTVADGSLIEPTTSTTLETTRYTTTNESSIEPSRSIIPNSTTHITTSGSLIELPISTMTTLTITSESTTTSAILTTISNTTYTTANESLVYLPLLTTRSAATKHTTISTREPSVNGDDFGGSGNFGTTDDDEDGRNDIATTTFILTTSQKTKNISDFTEHVKTTVFPFVSTEFSTGSDDLEASGDSIDDNEDETGEEYDITPTFTLASNTTTSVTTQTLTESQEHFTETVDVNVIDDSDDFYITGDVREKGKHEEDNAVATKLISSTIASTLTTHQQKNEYTTLTQALKESTAVITNTNQYQEMVARTSSRESNSIEGSGDLFTSGDDEDEGKEEEETGEVASTTKLISNSSIIFLTTHQQMENKNANETAVTTAQTQPLERSTEVFTEAVDVEISSDIEIIEDGEDINENSTTTSMSGLERPTETPVSVTSHQTTSRTSPSGVTKTNQSLSITGTTFSSEGDNDAITNNTTLREKKHNETITITTQTQPLRGSTERFIETVNVEASGVVEPTGDDEDTDAVGATSATEFAGFITTNQATTRTSSVSDDLFITGHNEDNGQEGEDRYNTSATELIGNSTNYTLTTLHQKKHDDKNYNETTVTRRPFRESTKRFTESVDIEGSGDMEIIGDDEDMDENSSGTSRTELRTTEIAVPITSHQTTKRTDAAEVIISNRALSATGTTFSSESEGIEGSGAFFINGDDEDDGNEDEDIFSASTKATLMNMTETHFQQIASNKRIINVPVTVTRFEIEDLEASGDIDIIEDDE